MMEWNVDVFLLHLRRSKGRPLVISFSIMLIYRVQGFRMNCNVTGIYSLESSQHLSQILP